MDIRYLLLISLFFSNASFAGLAIEQSLSAEYIVQSGENYEGNIVILNNGDRKEEVNITPYDLESTLTGMKFLMPNEGKRSNYKWLSFQPRTLILSPGEKGTVNYTIQIPENEKLSGSYWTGLMIAPVKGEISTFKRDIGDIKLVQRVKFLNTIITHADDSSIAKLEFSNPSLKDGILSVVVKNQGERAIVPDIWFDAYTEKGENMGRFEGVKSVLFPKQKRTLNVDVSKLKKGVYKGLFAAEDETGQIFGSNLTVEKLED